MKKIFLASAISSAILLTLVGCGSSSSDGASSNGGASNVIIAVSGTVADTGGATDISLTGLTVEARNPSDDSVLASTTTNASGLYLLNVPSADFYLHANGATNTTNTNVYVNDNLQIEHETADRQNVNFGLINATDFSDIGSMLGADPVNDAVFAMGVNDGTNGIAGVSVATTPAVSEIRYQQPDGTFISTGSTTTATDPSVVGWNTAPGTNATYTFTLTPDNTTAGYNIDSSFKLRLIPGEISEPIEP